METETEKSPSGMFSIGYALAPKKQENFIQPSLISLARSRGIDLIAIDPSKPLISQGPFDCVLHKLSGDEWRSNLDAFSAVHPEIPIIDRPDAIERLHNRISMLQVVSELDTSSSASGETFGIPPQVVVYDSGALADSVALRAFHRRRSRNYISPVNYEAMDYLPSPMLSIQEKIPSPISQAKHTAIADPELSTLLRDRSRFINTASSTSTIVSFESRLNQWSPYFRSLCKIEPHFIMALQRSHLEALHFTWKDSFKPSEKHSHTSIGSEKVAVLFNLAAVYSQMAAAENQGTIEGLNKAYKAFCNAEVAFLYLREILGGGESIDVSTECVHMLEKLMVAQAQECFFNRAVRDGLSPTNCSKAAREVELYYEEVLHALSTAPLNQHIDKGWFAHVQLKTSQFYAESCYHYSLHLDENYEIGEEIARLQMAADHLCRMKRTVEGASFLLVNVISKLEKNINSQLEKVKRDNIIYRMRVPTAGSLKNLPAYVSKRPV